MTLPPQIKEWMNTRGISDEVIEHNDIRFESNQIVIPVFGPDKKLLFNKYRRSPFENEGPKYKYDKGATSALYNANNLWTADGPVVIVEGELDAMRLQSGGYLAVSTTGGSGTFKKEWSELLEGYQVYICYDNDDAGIGGTIRVLEVFPHARVIEIPRETAVKDVTDYISKNGPERFVELFNKAQTWQIPQAPVDESKASLKKYAAEVRTACDNLADEIRGRTREQRSIELPAALLKVLQGKWEGAQKKINYTRPVIKDSDAILRARAVPVTEYIKVNKLGYASCINHNEKTPSMKYYKKNNKVKCFGCGFNGDTVDVVQKLFSLTVGEAIKKING